MVAPAYGCRDGNELSHLLEEKYLVLAESLELLELILTGQWLALCDDLLFIFSLTLVDLALFLVSEALELRALNNLELLDEVPVRLLVENLVAYNITFVLCRLGTFLVCDNLFDIFVCYHLS